MCKFKFNEYAKCGCDTFVDNFRRCPIASRPGQPAGMLCPIPATFYGTTGAPVGGRFSMERETTIPHDCSRFCCTRAMMIFLHERRIYDTYVQCEELFSIEEKDIPKSWKRKEHEKHTHFLAWLEHKQCRAMQSLDDHAWERYRFVQAHEGRARLNPEEVPERIGGFCEGEFEEFWEEMETALEERVKRTDKEVDLRLEALAHCEFQRVRAAGGVAGVKVLGIGPG